MMIFQYIVKPVIGYKTKRYQVQCAAKYIELGMQVRKIFMWALSGFFLMILAIVYSTVYFLVIFPNETAYTSSIQFWLALVSMVAVILTYFAICSQWFWIKLLRINEILSYIETDKNNNN
ncbi:MAG TPA: hypothetical protein PKC21_02760 [Oligoflexia bacterium]|nr:hypothetical protein [Oligoflexia bacterium]HMR24253.1 hypothetical protein [Oligoflexia bacterium]